MRALPPGAVAVDARGLGRRVDLVGRRDDGARAIDHQALRHAVIGDEMRGAVIVAAHLAVGLQPFDEAVQRVLGVDAPDRLLDAVAVEPRLRQGRIGLLAQDDLRAVLESKMVFSADFSIRSRP